MSLQWLRFDFTALRFRRSLPYMLAALTCMWASVVQWYVALFIPGLIFLGLGAAVWSAMRFGAFQSGGGRLASRQRLLEMMPQRVDNGCPRARNLRIYRTIAPVFWIVYVGSSLVIVLRTLPSPI